VREQTQTLTLAVTRLKQRSFGATAQKKIYSFIRRSKSMTDMVNSPPHYKDTEIECIDVMVMVFGKTAVKWYCLLNAFKYVWRCTKKHDGETDCIAKAIWYLRFSIGDDPRNDK